MTTLTVIIPAYNEERNILAGHLSYVATWASNASFSCSIIVVDDGSTDHTAALAERYMRGYGHVLSITHAGKAAAICAGILAADGDYILICDMDQSTPVKEFATLATYLDHGWDIAIGSRGSDRHGAPGTRKILSAAQRAMRGWLLGMYHADTQCGFKAMPRYVAQQVIEHLVIYAPDQLQPASGPVISSGFDVEFLLVAARLGFQVIEVPVTWHYEPSGRVHFVRDAIRGMQDLLAIASAARRGLYPTAQSLAQRVTEIGQQP